MAATLHKYVERGPGAGFANLTLPSGERLLLSLAYGRVSIHLLYLRGLVPGRAIHKADADSVARVILDKTKSHDARVAAANSNKPGARDP